MSKSKKTEQNPCVMVVDGDGQSHAWWKQTIGSQYRVQIFSDPFQAQRFAQMLTIDVVIYDVMTVQRTGGNWTHVIHHLQPSAGMLPIGTENELQEAVSVSGHNPSMLLLKPILDTKHVLGLIKRLLPKRHNLSVVSDGQAPVDRAWVGPDLVGQSPALHQVRQMIPKIANATAPVLICGESGTGKELVARAIHATGNRSEHAFVTVNCAALHENLIDSELFGYQRGAFTGADTASPGLFAAAHQGVLFLDEIGDVPLSTQVRLLRAIQEGEIRAVGASENQYVDVRVVVATNVNLDEAMRQKRFRQDLYYRISTFRLDLPPLRDFAHPLPRP